MADHVRLPARRAGRKIGRRDIDYLNVGFLKGDSQRKIARAATITSTRSGLGAESQPEQPHSDAVISSTKTMDASLIGGAIRLMTRSVPLWPMIDEKS